MQKVVYSKRRKLVLCILIAVLSALGIFVFTACAHDYTEADYKAMGFTVAVTYDFQGGTYKKQKTARILIKPNSKLPDLSIENTPSREGYSFKGFYLPKTDANGKVEKDANGKVIVSDEAWDFDNRTIGDKDLTLYAKWWDNYKVNLHYGIDKETKEDYVKQISLPCNRDGSPTALKADALNVDGYTFVSYNLVENSTNEETALMEFPYAFNETAFSDKRSIEVWSEWLEGEYILVRSKDDLTISTVNETTNYYLLADIDMEGSAYDNDGDMQKTKIPKYYSGRFVGNGHTISNFKMTLRAVDRTYDSFGLFRTLRDGAEITDVTFDNVAVSYYLSNANIQSYYLGLLAGQSSGKVNVKNVKFTSSGEGQNIFEYMIGIGVTNDCINIADDMLIAQRSDSTTLQNCSVSEVKHFYSSAVITADAEFALYIKYTEEDGIITLGKDAVYGLAQKFNDGRYYESIYKGYKHVDANKYNLTLISLTDIVYDIEFTIADGVISATMTEVSQ